MRGLLAVVSLVGGDAGGQSLEVITALVVLFANISFGLVSE